MTDTNNPPANPYAFPVSDIDGFTEHGMSLRDYFAAHSPVTVDEARGALIGDGFKEITYELLFRRVSQMRYIYADSMLQAKTRES